jgi:hypothetical protein
MHALRNVVTLAPCAAAIAVGCDSSSEQQDPSRRGKYWMGQYYGFIDGDI